MDLIIDIGISQSRSLIIDNFGPRNILIEDYSLKNISGNIYKGKVENINDSLGCAFVNIGKGKKGILHFDDCLYTVKKGEEILVQVIREPSGGKGARLSMNLSIPSKNLVLLINCKEINISRKIKSKSRRGELLSLGKSIIKKSENLGVILRTQCEFILDGDIINEYNYVKNIWDGIEKTWDYIKGEKLLYEANGFLNYIKREYISENISKVYINREIEREEILKFIKENDFKIEVATVEEGIDRSRLIKQSIDYALNRRFEVSGGGNIVVDETEALTIVDVNSASLNKEKVAEENFLHVNLNSIEKISQIISLKNSSGMILIDFINMDSEDFKEKVKYEVEKYFSEFKIKAMIHDFTALGILEISKAKKSKSLSEYVYVNKEKRELSPLYILKNLENDILNDLYKKAKKSFEINASEKIYNLINEIDFISLMKKIYFVDIKINKLNGITKDYILEDSKGSFARLSIDNKKVFGKVEEFNEDNEFIYVKIKKQS